MGKKTKMQRVIEQNHKFQKKIIPDLKLPYNPISDFYKNKFGEKVFKIPVSLADDCPNRAGIKGMKTCIFCDEWGSFAFPKSLGEELAWQIKNHKNKIAARFNSKKFLVYFQAYTTSFTQLKKLRDSFATALLEEDVVGIVVGTRPDCISDALLDLWNEYSEKTFVGVEFGVQSFDNKQLDWMRRGHSAEDAIKSIQRVQAQCPRVNLGIHLMFGWPNESEDDIVESAQKCNELKIHNIKLHNLHVLKNTPLAELFNEGSFEPINFLDYCFLVGKFLENLNPNIFIHRLSALSSQTGELIAPSWTSKKMTSYQGIIDYLNDHKIFQGAKYLNA